MKRHHWTLCLLTGLGIAALVIWSARCFPDRAATGNLTASERALGQVVTTSMPDEPALVRANVTPDAEVPQRQFQVVVTAELDRPVEDAVVIAYSSMADKSLRLKTDAHGQSPIPMIGEEITLYAVAPGYAPTSVPVRFRDCPDLIRVTLRTGNEYQGRVTDENGFPLAGAELSISCNHAIESELDVSPSQEGIVKNQLRYGQRGLASPNGSFRITGLHRPDGFLTARMPGYVLLKKVEDGSHRPVMPVRANEWNEVRLTSVWYAAVRYVSAMAPPPRIVIAVDCDSQYVGLPSLYASTAGLARKLLGMRDQSADPSVSEILVLCTPSNQEAQQGAVRFTARSEEGLIVDECSCILHRLTQAQERGLEERRLTNEPAPSHEVHIVSNVPVRVVNVLGGSFAKAECKPGGAGVSSTDTTFMLPRGDYIVEPLELWSSEPARRKSFHVAGATLLDVSTWPAPSRIKLQTRLEIPNTWYLMLVSNSRRFRFPAHVMVGQKDGMAVCVGRHELILLDAAANVVASGTVEIGAGETKVVELK
jgi:hypothetical protein